MVIKIALVLMAVLVIVYLVRCLLGYFLLKSVSRDSLIIFGKKGKGKTFLFSFLARMSKRGYASTTEFHHPGETLVSYSDINVEPNNWENVLDNNVIPIQKNPRLEGKPVFLDDAGVYLPNFADNMLKKRYDSLPVSLAVWRHLYNAPIHINSQDLGRCWKMVREQADGFIRVRGVKRHLFFTTIKFTYYEKYASAEQELNPVRFFIFNKYSKSENNIYNATNGVIKNGIVCALNSHHTYDSRYFHKVFFGYGPRVMLGYKLRRLRLKHPCKKK